MSIQQLKMALEFVGELNNLPLDHFEQELLFLNNAKNQESIEELLPKEL